MKPFIVSARTPEAFEHQVQSVLSCGYGIDNAPFVAGHLLCQWVKPMPNYYEWKLAVGLSLGDLQAEVQKYWEEEFDFLYSPLAHEAGNVFVQWVQKWKSVPTDALILHEEQKLVEGVQSEISGLKMVVGVQPVQLVVGEGLFSSQAPFPLVQE